MQNNNHPPRTIGRKPKREIGEEKQSRAMAAHRRKKSGVRIAIITICVLAAIFIAFTGYTYGYSNIHRGMRAGTISVGGMDKESAARAIDEGCAAVLEETSLSITIGEKEYPVSIHEVTDGMNSELTAEHAYTYTHQGGFLTRIGHVFSATLMHYEIPLSVRVNDEALNTRLEQIFTEAQKEPVAPSWKLDGDTLVIDRGTPGMTFDKEEIRTAVTQRIREMDFEPYEVSTSAVAPKEINLEEIKAEADTAPKNASVDKKDGTTILDPVAGIEMDLAAAQKQLKAADPKAQTISVAIKRTPAAVGVEQLKPVLFRDKISSASTHYRTSNAARANNVELASSFINGVILNPGEEFSYNDVVGERTTKRGFRPAGAYVSGQLVDEVGGGVCQPSSTLYMAVLRADLAVTSRTNHGLTVSYTPLGEDATVSYGAIDFRFRNDTGYPVKLVTDASGGTLTMSIIGTKTSDKKVTMESKTIATYAPETVKKSDSTLAKGETRVKQNGQTGYKVETYKIITENGKTTRVKIHTSTYRKKDRIILEGTKSE